MIKCLFDLEITIDLENKNASTEMQQSLLNDNLPCMQVAL